MKNYTTKRRAIEFSIDDDVFRTKPVISASTMFEFSNLQTRMSEAMNDPGQTVADVILDAFSKILDERSFEIFNERFFGLSSNPLDFDTFKEVTEDLLTEIAGKDQPQKPSSSKTGSRGNGSGRSSTAGA